MGGETWGLNFEMPSHYGLECDARSQWVLNVHSVDMRGALDKLGCYECWSVRLHESHTPILTIVDPR